MAKRPVFTTAENAPFYTTVNCEFEWFSGFSKAQKQRSKKGFKAERKR